MKILLFEKPHTDQTSSSKTNFYEREKDWANKTAEQFTQELIRRREWIGLLGQKSSELRLLDVACGPGMMSHVCVMLIQLTLPLLARISAESSA